MEVMNDAFYMRLALQMAERALGQTGINPVVGCVVVKDGRIVGLGTHLQRGTGHAEVHALNMAGAEAAGSTAYVTLEPCSHYGKTPPCSERLVREGVARVVVACTDPNPQVAGKGIALLRSHGIEVEVGVLEAEALKLNEKFFKFIMTKQPFVTLKTASTLDGKVASKTGDSKWISNEAAREIVHTLRHQHQGIMVGIGTVLADDPSLTTRLPVPGLHPTRIVVDSQLRIPLDAKLLVDGAAPTVIVTTDLADAEKAKAIEALGAKVLRCGSSERVDLDLAMTQLGELEIGSILLEGGGVLNGSMLEAGFVDKVVLFFAPKIIGGLASPGNIVFEGFERMSDAITLDEITVEQLGDNVCITGYPKRG
ncbi:riboflavin biosynthesis protein RibD [Paenibacillus selenitireducens]|uniref:Riboflavin biosynthesis protein RibD n=1 Tax=Paenibacillus selenitireducens TaxID=1324314 RepID=A0A1T2XND7_9BACL|nr:bifunctional diaminohydroxyphosphoribosylaminopyrimidine deaminase/5-amino-6-(5-phosphoribosylamino)uracil reductase RibD [Paenibacillus selenitireducens]OPA81389.1 riboflavin biosynthesis protein RibD [Paenibacillus selenitireducens]